MKRILTATALLSVLTLISCGKDKANPNNPTDTEKNKQNILGKWTVNSGTAFYKPFNSNTETSMAVPNDWLGWTEDYRADGTMIYVEDLSDTDNYTYVIDKNQLTLNAVNWDEADVYTINELSSTVFKRTITASSTDTMYDFNTDQAIGILTKAEFNFSK